MHDADVDEHVCHEAPSLVAAERIVNEEGGRRSVGVLADLFVIMRILAVSHPERERQIKTASKLPSTVGRRAQMAPEVFGDKALRSATEFVLTESK